MRYIPLILLIISCSSLASPKIKTVFGKNDKNFAQIKIINETTENLACYIAVDGYKIKFILTPRNHSKWYDATNINYNYTHFTSWCDYLNLHPEYNKYRD